jgi:adenylylsulfate kinase-like enzyme
MNTNKCLYVTASIVFATIQAPYCEYKHANTVLVHENTTNTMHVYEIKTNNKYIHRSNKNLFKKSRFNKVQNQTRSFQVYHA